MSLNFRELTNQECLANREMLATESARSALERNVLANLGQALAAYKGPVKQLPSGAMSEHNPELNLACKKRRETASKGGEAASKGGEAAKVAKRQKVSVSRGSP